MSRCEWKIRWTFGTDAQCERDHHIDQVIITPRPGGQFSVVTIGDGQPDTHEHRSHISSGQVLTWGAGDRREFTGDWPGLCTGKVPGCVLRTGHHGRCAP